MTSPSGRQLHLHAGDTHATVVEVGGGLRTLSVDGSEILDGYADDEPASGGRGQILAPWPNRLRDGRWTWDGREQQLPLSEAGLHNAIHGLVRWVPWAVDASTETTASLRCELFPQPGYPFRLSLSATYDLAPGELAVTLTARNLGSGPAPVGLGMHPYLRVGAGVIDDAELTLSARHALVVDDRSLPVGERASTGWSGPIGAAVLDTTWGGLERSEDGLARVTVAGPERAVTVWMDQAWHWVQVFSGDTLPVERRRRGLAVEPLTCPPDALRSGRDLVVLAPGGDLTGRFGISVRAGHRG